METRPYNYLVHVLPWVQHPNPERASCKLFPFKKKKVLYCVVPLKLFLPISTGLVLAKA